MKKAGQITTDEGFNSNKASPSQTDKRKELADDTGKIPDKKKIKLSDYLKTFDITSNTIEENFGSNKPVSRKRRGKSVSREIIEIKYDEGSSKKSIIKNDSYAKVTLNKSKIADELHLNNKKAASLPIINDLIENSYEFGKNQEKCHEVILKRSPNINNRGFVDTKFAPVGDNSVNEDSNRGLQNIIDNVEKNDSNLRKSRFKNGFNPFKLETRSVSPCDTKLDENQNQKNVIMNEIEDVDEIIEILLSQNIDSQAVEGVKHPNMTLISKKETKDSSLDLIPYDNRKIGEPFKNYFKSNVNPLYRKINDKNIDISDNNLLDRNNSTNINVIKSDYDEFDAIELKPINDESSKIENTQNYVLNTHAPKININGDTATKRQIKLEMPTPVPLNKPVCNLFREKLDITIINEPVENNLTKLVEEKADQNKIILYDSKYAKPYGKKLNISSDTYISTGLGDEKVGKYVKINELAPSFCSEQKVIAISHSPEAKKMMKEVKNEDYRVKSRKKPARRKYARKVPYNIEE